MVYIVFLFSVFKKERGLITSSTFPGYRQTPNHLKRVIAHACRREPSTSVLDDFLQFADFGKQEQKANASSLCPYVYLSS